MSEFRIFCMAAFAGMGLAAAASNHEWIANFNPDNLAMLLWGFVCGCFAITLFGRRA